VTVFECSPRRASCGTISSAALAEPKRRNIAKKLIGPIVSVRHSRSQSRRSCGSSSRADRARLSFF
jgi:hypothetical protein